MIWTKTGHYFWSKKVIVGMKNSCYCLFHMNNEESIDFCLWIQYLYQYFEMVWNENTNYYFLS